jgi:hypothetical protein
MAILCLQYRSVAEAQLYAPFGLIHDEKRWRQKSAHEDTEAIDDVRVELPLKNCRRGELLAAESFFAWARANHPQGDAGAEHLSFNDYELALSDISRSGTFPPISKCPITAPARVRSSASVSRLTLRPRASADPIESRGIDRDRGTPRDATPPTPPGIRVRTTAVRPS